MLNFIFFYFLFPGQNLKVIATTSAGYEHIDIEECKRRGILVGHSPDSYTVAVAEFTVGLIISTIRKFKEGK